MRKYYVFGVATYVVHVHEDRTVRSFSLQNLLSNCLESGHLVLGLFDDPFQRSKFTWCSTRIQQVDIDVLWEWEFALGDSLKESGLSATVLAEKTVSSSVGNLQLSVVEEDLAVEHQTGRGNFYITTGLQTGQHTGRDSVTETIFVLLE